MDIMSNSRRLSAIARGDGGKNDWQIAQLEGVIEVDIIDKDSTLLLHIPMKNGV